jgi:hypothetical protein
MNHHMTFRALGAPPAGASDQEKKDTQDENRRKVLENLVKQLPAEATGLYLMGLDVFQGSGAGLTVAMVFGAVVLVMVRVGLKSSVGVIGTSLVSYVLWVYATGNGPFQLLLDALQLQLPAGVGTFAIAAWTTLVSVAANNGWIK